MTKIWKLRPPSPSASDLANETGITPLQAQLLINRGITDTSSALSFLTPRLSDLTDPMLLKDMDMAVEMIVGAIENQENITIYGDYDADGITATALLVNFFSSLGIQVSYYVPHRLTEGYSLNFEAVERMARDGVGLIVTVDCGTTNRKEIERIREKGMKIVVTDHHQVPKDFEPICPVVNPQRSDSSFPFQNLAGVGLAFFLAVAVRAALREQGWFRDRAEPDLKDYLDLVALGTVADMVPLLEQNRILVKWGIERIKASLWPGIKAIQEMAVLNGSGVTPYDIAFKFAPRLNAPGRMGSAKIGVEVLTTADPAYARDLVGQLNALNIERQSIEQGILEQIESTVSAEDIEARRTLVISGKGWHRGVLGIVASRLVDKYRRPTLVLDIKDGKATGSGRSIEGFNLHRALERLGHLFERFGGHYHAVGFALDAANIKVLGKELEGLAQELLSEDDLIPKIEIDAEVSLPHLTLQTLKQMEALSPYGSGNPEPVLCSHALQVLDSRVVGERHLKLKVKQEGSVLEAIGFGFSDRHPLQGETINMAFTPEINEWQGYERIQLRIVDLELADQGS
ncbi:MAG: single-stranded-DNA-specific exonuclease RecJ [Deltaproteobacteria bacterium]|nr:MAG: single-stranded-DNA-specific exonuclease RecJ [Deltaproteobacteria bacterium]